MADSSPLDVIFALPEALQPHVPLGPPGQPIKLYFGELHFLDERQEYQADGLVYLDWFPSPAIRFEVPMLPPDVDPKHNFTLKIGGSISRASAFATRITYGSGTSLRGVLTDRVVLPGEGRATQAAFLVPNFDWLFGDAIRYGEGTVSACRTVLSGGGWIITLDAVRDHGDVLEVLNSRSAFGITHIGRLVRDDGGTFSAAEALDLLDALRFYLSFAAGRWTGPCLPIGFDATGAPIWHILDPSNAAPYRQGDSWLVQNHHHEFQAPFSGFMRLWLDSDGQEILRFAIHWYIEANAQVGAVEGSIVLTQAAFELLSSMACVVQHSGLSAKQFDDLPAAKRIRHLFDWAGIPQGLPAELSDLTRLAQTDGWPDSATAMTKIRNTITHMTTRNRQQFGTHQDEARFDAWTLGLRNLELCLLRLCGHTGHYSDRISRQSVGETVLVPWAGAQPSP